MANKWITGLVEPDSPERRLSNDLAAQRHRWAMRKTADGKVRFEQVVTRAEAKAEVESEVRKALKKLSAQERLALAKRLVERDEYVELRKSESDPSVRIGQLAARGIDGADVQPLGRNEKSERSAAPAIEVDHGDGDLRPLGRDRAEGVTKARRTSFDDIFGQPAWNGTRYDD
jgi:hypothetical protein